MCNVCIANNINRNVYMYLNTRIFPTTGYAQVLLFMFIRRELGGKGTGCLFQFTTVFYMLENLLLDMARLWREIRSAFSIFQAYFPSSTLKTCGSLRNCTA